MNLDSEQSESEESSLNSISTIVLHVQYSSGNITARRLLGWLELIQLSKLTFVRFADVTIGEYIQDDFRARRHAGYLLLDCRYLVLLVQNVHNNFP
jgi:hypothetical protein